MLPVENTQRTHELSISTNLIGNSPFLTQILDDTGKQMITMSYRTL